MIKLTKTQIDILRHRIESGCIPEVLAESDICTVELADDAVMEVRRMLDAGGFDDQLSAIELEVIADCLDGSTYFANIDDAVALKQISKGAALMLFRAANELDALVSRLLGRPICCVRN